MLRRYCLVLFCCISSLLVYLSNAQEASKEGSKPNFTGSESCRKCHQEQYQGWQQTRMANVVRDPKKHPEAVLGDFSHPDPGRTFDLGEVAFVYGSRWKQRYFTRRPATCAPRSKASLKPSRSMGSSRQSLPRPPRLAVQKRTS